ncbi:GTPase [Undibacterium sp. SXout7W]|uniref:GTPase n=1 Tax=Undibacterium sp. SXout7W TaxID=3413049 RepID=UPI003BF15D69
MRQPVPLTLVSGGSYQQREAAIHDAIQRSSTASDTTSSFISDNANASAAVIHAAIHAVILEGLPDGKMILSESPQLSLQRIAPGCFCCIGNLPMRVSLNRALRQPVQRIYLGVASSAHLDAIRSALLASPYDQLLLADYSICL